MWKGVHGAWRSHGLLGYSSSLENLFEPSPLKSAFVKALSIYIYDINQIKVKKKGTENSFQVWSFFNLI